MVYLASLLPNKSRLDCKDGPGPSGRLIRSISGIAFIVTLLTGLLASPVAATAWNFETVEKIAISDGWSRPALALDSSGNPRISYYDPVTLDLRYAERNGGKWTIETVASGDFDPGVSLALDGSGNPRIGYLDNTSQDLRYAERNGGKWTIETVYSSLDEAVKLGSVSLALESDGNPRIGYKEFSFLIVHDPVIKYAERNGGKWTVETACGPQDKMYELRSVSLALDTNGNPRLTANTFDTLVYAERNGGNWTVETAVNADVMNFFGPLALDSNGNPRLSYSGYTSIDKHAYGALNYAEKNGGKWTIENIYVGNQGEADSLALDNNGNPRISFTSGGLEYLEKNEGIWTFDHMDDNKTSVSSLVIDDKGNPRISYFDLSNKVLKYTENDAPCRKCKGVCCYGECIAPDSNPDNCGSCGHTCAQGLICRGGTCMLEKQVPELRVYDFFLLVAQHVTSAFRPSRAPVTWLPSPGSPRQVYESPDQLVDTMTADEKPDLGIVVMEKEGEDGGTVTVEMEPGQKVLIEQSGGEETGPHTYTVTEREAPDEKMTGDVLLIQGSGDTGDNGDTGPYTHTAYGKKSSDGGITADKYLIACPAGYTNCNGKCTDLKSDRDNCGSCGTICPSGQACNKGTCVQAGGPVL